MDLKRNRAIPVVWIHVELYEPQETDPCKGAAVVCAPLKRDIF